MKTLEIRHLVLFVCLMLAASNRLIAQVVVDYANDETLLPLFKAGLHPRQERSYENMYCKLPRQQTVIFDFGEVRLPPVTADWSFDVQADDKLNLIKGHLNRALTKKEAIEIATGLNQALHVPVEPMIDFVTRYPESSPGAQVYRASVKVKNGAQVGYYFQHRFRDDKPLSIAIEIQWKRPLREIKPRREPIKPPPGYENVSMEPEDAPLNANEKEPDVASSPTAQKGIQKVKSNPAVVPETKDRSWLWWLLVVITATVGAVWVFLRKSK